MMLFTIVISLILVAIAIIGARKLSSKAQPKRNKARSKFSATSSQPSFSASTTCSIVGIDLGTTNSKVCGIKDGKLTVIPNSIGGMSIPSLVMFMDYGGFYVGHEAKNHAKRFESTNCLVGSIKRKILKERGTVWNGKKHHPQFIFALILASLKKQAEQFFDRPVTQAVIAVPASFGINERQIIKDAGEIAGLQILRLVNEPTAAALAYGLDKKNDETIVVYDFGGGTFDISVLEIGEGVFEVKATSGDMFLGGQDFDERLRDYLCERIKKEYQFDVANDRVALARLEEGVEEAKKNLSFSAAHQLTIPYFFRDKHLDISIDRSVLESLTNDLIEKSITICKKTLKDAGLSARDIDGVLLVGGQTRMPAIRQAVEKLFGNIIIPGPDLDTAVVKGNAVMAGVLKGDIKDILLLDVLSHSVGVGIKDGVFEKLIKRNALIPTKEKKTFTTTNDNQTSVGFTIHEGENELSKLNKIIGQVELDGILPAKAGKPVIDVTFDVECNGMVRVSAKDSVTGKETKVILVSSEKLPREDMLGLITQVRRWEKSEAL